MSDTATKLAGDALVLDEYRADFADRFWRTDRRLGGWKLERRQTFREPGNDSWAAALHGDWERSKTLLEKRRDTVRGYQQKILDHGFEFHRVRVADKPYSPYLIWELNSLMIRHEYGERIKVISADAISELERRSALPEIVVLGDEVVYEVRYDEAGTPTGAIRSTAAAAVRYWRDLVRGLHERGEYLPDFFAREIADLRPTPAG